MILEKLKDKELKSRIEGYINKFPRRMSHNNPSKNPVYAEAVRELTKNDDLICLPPDKVITINKKIENINMLLPSAVVEYFIKTASHRVIMRFCICRESMECKNYPIDLGCIFLGDAAKEIHPELGDEASVEEALEHAKKCKEAGLVSSIGRNKLDSIWLGVEPEEKLLSICNCCPCCCITRSVPYAASEVGAKYAKMPGVDVFVNNNCIGCGACVSKCIFQAITMQDDRAIISENCRGCGRCIDACPKKAIKLTINNQSADETIKRISQNVLHK